MIIVGSTIGVAVLALLLLTPQIHHGPSKEGLARMSETLLLGILERNTKADPTLPKRAASITNELFEKRDLADWRWLLADEWDVVSGTVMKDHSGNICTISYSESSGKWSVAVTMP